MKQAFAKVAVVGRPNVGKSTLFNRLVRERKSIVDETPGVTRDRLYADVDWNGKCITFIDTGGLVENGTNIDDFTCDVKKQVYYAIEEADFILFMVDGKSGLTAEDKRIASKLRKIKSKKEIFLAVNKIDTEKQEDLIYEFYSLGFENIYPISALCGSGGLADILDEIAKSSFSAKPLECCHRIAIVGKPNVGKSSVLNCLVNSERSIVSPLPGTTRDAIDTKITTHGKNYLLIDTAGLRKKSKISSHIERYSVIRAVSSIEKADVVLFIIDATSNVTDQDQKIASLIKRRFKPSIILVNKWDLINNKGTNMTAVYQKNILSSLHFIDYSKILFISALLRKNINKTWDLINEVYSSYQRRIPTGRLNKIIEDACVLTSPPSKKGKSLRIYYVTQTNVEPPEIIFFVNDSKLVTKQYEKYLEREIRGAFDFSGTPIRMVFRNKR